VVTSADLVGLMMSTLIWFGPSLRSLRTSFFRIGITKVGAVPNLVTASTMTSLCYMNNGIVAAWTSDIQTCPVALVRSRLQGRSEIMSSCSLSIRTHAHEVRGTGGEDQVPARAVAEAEADEALTSNAHSSG
jgi:hypothetical protein